MKYKIRLIDHLRMLSHLIITDAILFVLYIWYFRFTIPTAYFYWLFLLLFLTQILPTVWVHYNHYLLNKNSVFILDVANNSFQFDEPDIKIKANFNEIECVKFVGSYGGGTGVYSFGEYCFCAIKMKDGRNFIVTSLLVPSLKSKFKNKLGIPFEESFKILAIA
ncbi:MAG: hypothetical protein K2X48_13700 [Chitinophagaceae bacterium]|nr:hypothetical protein [Chitinophagaceae bacterium]